MTPHGDGDGWVHCAEGHRHWGLFGAAGLLLRRDDAGTAEVLLQHRATWSHHGGTWGLLGGARHHRETVVDAALREAGEEGGLDPAYVEVHGRFDDSHGGWTYATVLAGARRGAVAQPTGGESIDVAWVAVEDVTSLPLHPGLAGAWPSLRGALHQPTVVVDAANVVGSRPDGWWRDRAGAARRLVEAVAGLSRSGLERSALPPGWDLPELTCWWPRWVVVLEGAARPAAQNAPQGVCVVAAEGSGDDAIVQAVHDAGGGPVLVVTADRGLRDRCHSIGAASVGSRWLADMFA